MSCTAAMFNHSSEPTHQVVELLVERESPKLKIAIIDGERTDNLESGDQCFIQYRPDDVVKSYFGV